MVSEGVRHSVRALSHEGVLLEAYQYAPGPATETPKHSHGKYQFCLSLNFPGEYHYRGETHAVPVGSLSVIHPGEVHLARDPRDRELLAEFRMIYAEPSTLQRAVAEIAEREKGLPHFPDPIVLDERLAGRFLALHMAWERPTSKLEKDSRLLSVLSKFVVHHASERLIQRPEGRERWAVSVVRRRLENDPAKDVSLEELARAANLSPYHLSRVFKEEVGMPPHAYQMNVRLEWAKDLLLRGWPISAVAQETGFYDQSHLTRYFKRFVGVTPGNYAGNSKIFQY